jgi:hypothetical protein
MIPTIRVQRNIRQPITSHATTGLNAARVPDARGAPHVAVANTRLRSQVSTAVPGKLTLG